jgi:hypothetical protein
MEYLLPTSNSHPDRNFFPISILTMAKLEHLDETRQEAIDRTSIRQWNTLLWAQQNHKIKNNSMGDIIIWLPKGKNKHIGKNK